MSLLRTRDHYTRKLEEPLADYPGAPQFEKYTCRHCGESEEIQMYGSSFIHEKSFEEKCDDILRDHLANCQQYQRWLKETSIA